MSRHSADFISCARSYGHPPFSGGRHVFVEGQSHALPRIMPPAFHQRQITLLDQSRTNLTVQVHERRAAFGEEQNSGSFPVKPMNQFQEFPIGMLSAQLLYDTEAHAAAAMNRKPRRLVNYHERFIFI
jgi:hypothetical protein